jgi:hypothetical protein
VGSIYLIRHGQASFGADDYDVLSPVGVRQAKSSVATWQTGPPFDRCVPATCAASNTRPRRWSNTAPSACRSRPGNRLRLQRIRRRRVIRALLPDLLDEPEALDILRNAAQNRASSSASSP